MGEVRYRVAREEDSEALYTLACALKAKQLDRGACMEAIRKGLASEEVVYMVAESDEGVMGYAQVIFFAAMTTEGKVAYIEELCIAEAWRGRGVGSEFLDVMRELGRERGCVRMELTSGVRRVDAHRFYEREGMKKTGYKFVEEW